jgi:hypothetical protein
MATITRSLIAVGASVAWFALAASAHADPTRCQINIVKQLLRLEKTHLSTNEKCLDAENIGKVPGPCPDAKGTLKIASARAKVADKLASTCTNADIAALGYTTCAFEPAPAGRAAQCAALPASTVSEMAACVSCWKEALLSDYVATLYASHAVEACGGDVGATSSVCTGLDCNTPLPDQRDLGDSGENDCQRSIGKAGVKYLLATVKTLGTCGLRGGTEATCTSDPDVQLKLAKNADKLGALVRSKCGNRSPTPSVPFCCRSGTGNACVAATTREECETLGGDAQENKTCGMDNTCDPIPGGQSIGWWATCPISNTCPGTTLEDLGDLIDCVDATALETADRLLCRQIPSGWDCPGSPSAAFLE